MDDVYFNVSCDSNKVDLRNAFYEGKQCIPPPFGKAFRIAHELGIKYGDTRVHGREILDEIDVLVRGFLAQLPPEGEELIHETRFH